MACCGTTAVRLQLHMLSLRRRWETWGRSPRLQQLFRLVRIPAHKLGRDIAFVPPFFVIRSNFVCPGSPEVGFVQRARIVPALPNVTATAMRRVPVGSIPSVRILQSWPQNVRLLRRSNEVNMVRHQTIANQFYLVTLRAPAQQVEVNSPVSIAVEDTARRIYRAPFAPMGGDLGFWDLHYSKGRGTWPPELYFLGRDSGGTSPARR